MKITCYKCGPKDAQLFPAKALKTPDKKHMCCACTRELGRQNRRAWGLK